MFLNRVFSKVVGFVGVCSMLAIPFGSYAADINFSGTVDSTCAFSNITPGTIVVNVNRMAMSSGNSALGGAGAQISYIADQASNLNFTALSFVEAPAGYNQANASLKLTVHDGATDDVLLATDTGDRTLAVAGDSTVKALTVHARIDDTNGFIAGNYSIVTVVTCIPEAVS